MNCTKPGQLLTTDVISLSFETADFILVAALVFFLSVSNIPEDGQPHSFPILSHMIAVCLKVLALSFRSETLSFVAQDFEKKACAAR